MCEPLNLQSTNKLGILLKFAEFPVSEPISGLWVKFQTWRKVCKFYTKMKLLASTFRNAGLTVIRSNPRWVTGGKPRPTRFCKFWSTYNLGRSKRLEECWSTYPLASLEANSFEKLADFARENFFAIFVLGWPQMTLTPDFLIICILCVKFELRPKMTQKL